MLAEATKQSGRGLSHATQIASPSAFPIRLTHTGQGGRNGLANSVIFQIRLALSLRKSLSVSLFLRERFPGTDRIHW